MKLIATRLHGYREDGERFECEESLARTLIEKGAAVIDEKKETKQKKAEQ